MENVSKKVNKKSILITGIILFQIFSYIVLSNAFTINLGNRMPLKLSEIFSIVTFISAFYFLIKNKWKFKSLKRSKNRWIYVWIIYAFVLDFICLIINGYAFNDFAYGLFYLFRIIHLLLLVRALNYLIDCQKISKKWLVKFIKMCYFLVVLIGLFQYLVYPIAYDWYGVFYKLGFYWPTPDPHHDRLLSTYLDPNYLASCLLIPIAICFAELIDFNNRRNKNNSLSIKLILEIVIFVIAILLTKSRSGMVGLIVVLIFYFIFYELKKPIGIYKIVLYLLMLITFFYLFFFSNITVFERIRNFYSDPSAMHRFDSWKYSLQYYKDTNFLGIGYNMLGAYKLKIGEEVGRAASYGMDSSLLFILVTTNIIGLGIVLYGFYKIFKYKNHNLINIAVKMILITSIVISFFNNLLFNPVWMFPVFLIEMVLNNPINKIKGKGLKNESIIN